MVKVKGRVQIAPPDEVENPQEYSDPPKKTRVGFADFTNNQVKTTELQVHFSPRRWPILYIEADSANTDFIKFGGEGHVVHRLNAGDVWPLFDVAPQEVYVVANSGTQTVHIIGTGDPDA